MTGIDIQEYNISDNNFIAKESGNGGIISSVPAIKIDEEKQNFDISVLMRSLNGYDYSVLFVSKPYSLDKVQDMYSNIIDVRDKCFAVSKRNVSKQTNESTSDTKSITTSPKHSFSLILYSYNSGKSISDTVATTIGTSETVALDIQNGFAVELMEYCDKAIERLKQGQNLGLWGTAISYHAENPIAANIIKA